MSDSSANNLRFQCPKCRKTVAVTEDQAGTRMGCPSCKQSILVPGARPSSEPTLSDLLDLGEDPVQAAPTKGAFKSTAPPSTASPSTVSSEESEALTLSKDDYIADVEDDDPEDSILELPGDEGLLDEGLLDEKSVEARESEAKSPEAGVSSTGLPETGLPETGLDEADVQLIDDDLLDINEPISVAEKIGKPSVTIAELANEAPFEHDKFAPLAIDGITLPDNAITMSCPVCGTRIDAKPSEIGSKKKCPDCYSMVEIVAQHGDLLDGSYKLAKEDDSQAKQGKRSTAKNSNASSGDATPVGTSGRDAGEVKISQADDVYGLAPLEELEPVENYLTTGEDDRQKETEEPESHAKTAATRMEERMPDVSRPSYDLPDANDWDGSIPNEQAMFVAPEDPVESVEVVKTPVKRKPVKLESVNVVEPVKLEPVNVVDPFKLEPIKLEPIKLEPVQSTAIPVAPVLGDEPVDVRPVDDGPADPPDLPHRQKKNNDAKPESDRGDLRRLNSGFGDWVSQIGSIFTSAHLHFRVAICSVILGIAYVIADWSEYFFNLDDNPLVQFFGTGITCLALAVVFGAAVFATTIFASNLIEYEIGEVPKQDRWSSPFPDSMISKFMAFGPGVGLAMIPGAFLGTLFYSMTESVAGLYLLMLVSGMTLGPLLVLAAIYNEHPFHLFSREVVVTLQSHRFRWIRFYLGSIVLFLCLVPLCFLLFVNSVFVTFLVAVVTVYLGFTYAQMFGILAHDVLDYIGRVRDPKRNSK